MESQIKDSIYFLEQGIQLLYKITDEQYIFLDKRVSHSHSGQHFRHNIDFYNCFLIGLETGLIDYDQRTRDALIESNRNIAISYMTTVIEKMKSLSELDKSQSIQVVQNDDNGIDIKHCQSTIERELMFLVSHTVHHYAIIGILLRYQGIQLDLDFGKAPSTITYEHQQKS